MFGSAAAASLLRGDRCDVHNLTAELALVRSPDEVDDSMPQDE